MRPRGSEKEKETRRKRNTSMVLWVKKRIKNLGAGAKNSAREQTPTTPNQLYQLCQYKYLFVQPRMLRGEGNGETKSDRKLESRDRLVSALRRRYWVCQSYGAENAPSQYDTDQYQYVPQSTQALSRGCSVYSPIPQSKSELRGQT